MVLNHQLIITIVATILLMTYRMSQKMLKSIGMEIKRARRRQGKRALDIAIETDTEPSYYSKIENGKARPSLQKIYAICRALGLKTEEILPF